METYMVEFTGALSAEGAAAVHELEGYQRHAPRENRLADFGLGDRARARVWLTARDENDALHRVRDALTPYGGHVDFTSELAA